ncbi:MAG: energy transducer TonB [Ignavibacteriaceae bacterium]
MKRGLFTAFLFTVLFSWAAIGEEDPYKPIADVMPEPVGGYESLYKKIVYPDLARKSGVQGKIYVLVYINETGTVDDAKVVKGIGAGCDEAALDVIKKAKFSPGKIQGQASKIKLTVPFIFKLG